MKRDELKKIAIEMVKEQGIINLTCVNLCKEAGIKYHSFAHYAGSYFKTFIDEVKLECGENFDIYKFSGARVYNKKYREKQILLEAVRIAQARSCEFLTLSIVAKKLGLTVGAVVSYFKNIKNLKNAVIQYAEENDIEINLTEKN